MPGCGPASESGGGSEDTFSSSLLFRHAAFGFRFLSVQLKQKAVSNIHFLERNGLSMAQTFKIIKGQLFAPVPEAAGVQVKCWNAARPAQELCKHPVCSAEEQPGLILRLDLATERKTCQGPSPAPQCHRGTQVRWVLKVPGPLWVTRVRHPWPHFPQPKTM